MLVKENERSPKIKELNLSRVLASKLYTYMICICIMTKPVTLSNAAYEALKKVKGKDMSFSDAVLKLVERYNTRRDFNKFAGVLKAQAGELEKFKLQIQEDRTRNVEKM
ncbi:MAG: antitoxin VapB family protein [Candidatus Thermoplasmatota archaeon]|nr:antitoxin VapB family protein [Candidatus Thermoplasmatota archaeon]